MAQGVPPHHFCMRITSAPIHCMRATSTRMSLIFKSLKTSPKRLLKPKSFFQPLS